MAATMEFIRSLQTADAVPSALWTRDTNPVDAKWVPTRPAPKPPVDGRQKLLPLRPKQDAESDSETETEQKYKKKDKKIKLDRTSYENANRST